MSNTISGGALMKAFISYSHKDKALVDRIAKQLGRLYCLYDTYCFETGDDLIRAISDSLNKSSIFVLLAGRNSKNSIYVNLEIETAKERLIYEHIRKALVYIIDDSLSVDSLPDWLKRGVVAVENNYSTIARDIEHHLNKHKQELRPKLFIGRSQDLSNFEALMHELSHESSPRFFLVIGLPGIGRRTFIKHCAFDVFGFKKTVEFKIEEGDSLNDVCLKISELTELYNSNEEFLEIFKRIQLLNISECEDAINIGIEKMMKSSELPIFIDEGGFIDQEGDLSMVANNLIGLIQSNKALYAAFVSHRKPRERTGLRFACVRLGPLTKDNTSILLQRIANNYGLEMTRSDVNELTEYVTGYPPSAYYAMRQASDYGIDTLLSDKSKLVQFRMNVFVRHISQQSLNNIDKLTLQLLAYYSPLTFQTIKDTVEQTREDIETTIMKLIDMSLVAVTGDGLYQIADPIADAAMNTYGLPDQKLSETIAMSLHNYIRTRRESSRFLPLSRVLFRASVYIDKPEYRREIANLPNDLIRIAERLYHSRKYKKCIEYARAAIKERPSTITGRSYLIRALIQQEYWSEANVEIDNIKKYSQKGDVEFLRGFYERKRDNYRDAILHFEEAIKLGRRDAAVHRELSQSYFLVKDHTAAMASLNKALKIHGDNKFIVDLWAQISTEMGDEVSARKALERLELIDENEYYHFRKSRVEVKFGNKETAPIEAVSAMGDDDKPPFSFIAQAILCYIMCDEIDEAKKLMEKLDSEYGDIRRDVRTGLNCRILLAEGNYEEALELTDKFINKGTGHYDNIVKYANYKIKQRMPHKENTAMYDIDKRVEYNDIIMKKYFDIPEIENM